MIATPLFRVRHRTALGHALSSVHARPIKAAANLRYLHCDKSVSRRFGYPIALAVHDLRPAGLARRRGPRCHGQGSDRRETVSAIQTERDGARATKSPRKSGSTIASIILSSL